MLAMWLGLLAAQAKETKLPSLPPANDYGSGTNKTSTKATKKAKPMTLEQVLTQATKVSPDLQTAKLEVERMMRRLYGVRLKYYPEFNVVAEVPRVLDYNEERGGAKPQSFDQKTTEPGVGVSFKEHLPSNTDLGATYERDISNRGIHSDGVSLLFSQELARKDPIWKEQDFATKRVWLTRQAEASIDREFAYQVKLAYFTAVEATLLQDNAVERFQQDKLFTEESEKKYKAGIIAEYMVLDYRRDFEQSQSRLVVRRSGLERARNEMLYLLQQPFDSPVTFKTMPEPVIDPKLCDMRRMIDAGLHSELRIAELRFNLFANEENLRYIKNSLLPSVRLQAGANWDNTRDTVGTAADFNSRELSAGLLISIPLFRDQFEKGNNITLEGLDQTINEITITDWFRVMARNVRNDLISVQELRERHEIANRIYQISARDFELSKLRFEVGNVSSWDMIRSKNEYFGALDDLITLRYSLLRRLAAIERDYPFLETEAAVER
jgi:outer membrane protein TolC